MIAAGRLNKRLQLQAKIPIKDAFGHTNKSDWSPITNLWASLESVSARQVISSQQVIGEVTHQIKIRYRPGMTDKHRFVFKGRAFNILHVINVKEKNIVLEFLCKEGPLNG